MNLGSQNIRRWLTCLLLLGRFTPSAQSAEVDGPPDLQDGAAAPAAEARPSIRDRIGKWRARAHQTQVEMIDIAGLKVAVWRPAAAGPAPIIIFSHGFHGNAAQTKFLMKALADAGYLVFAPNHADAIRGGNFGGSFRPEVSFAKPQAWTDQTYQNRGHDITNLIAALKADPQWTNRIDWDRLGLAGHSLGGYTVLGLAGAWPSWKTPAVKAVLALSPYCTPYIRNGKLADLIAPVMYQGGTADFGITPTVARPGGAYDLSRSPKYFVKFNSANHFAWTDLSRTFQASINAYSVAFFDTYLRGKPALSSLTRPADVVDLRSQ